MKQPLPHGVRTDKLCPLTAVSATVGTGGVLLISHDTAMTGISDCQLKIHSRPMGSSQQIMATSKPGWRQIVALASLYADHDP